MDKHKYGFNVYTNCRLKWSRATFHCKYPSNSNRIRSPSQSPKKIAFKSAKNRFTDFARFTRRNSTFFVLSSLILDRTLQSPPGTSLRLCQISFQSQLKQNTRSVCQWIPKRANVSHWHNLVQHPAHHGFLAKHFYGNTGCFSSWTVMILLHIESACGTKVAYAAGGCPAPSCFPSRELPIFLVKMDLENQWDLAVGCMHPVYCRYWSRQRLQMPTTCVVQG